MTLWFTLFWEIVQRSTRSDGLKREAKSGRRIFISSSAILDHALLAEGAFNSLWLVRRVSPELQTVWRSCGLPPLCPFVLNVPAISMSPF